MNFKKLFFAGLILFAPMSVFAEFPDDFSNVSWHGTNVSNWAETSVLNVSVNGAWLTLDYDKKRTWPGSLNANPWIIVKVGSTWHATTFEYFRFGQISKPWARVLDGGRTGHMQGEELSGWVPAKGEIYGFMVTGLARTAQRNVEERTNIALYQWGVGSYEPEPKPHVLTPIISNLLD